jgi:hypothetical protein
LTHPARSEFKIENIPTGEIDPVDRWTDCSLGPIPASLGTSIGELGITHPLLVVRESGTFQIVCGHRRLQAAIALGLEAVPARIAPPMDAAAKLTTNLIENAPHRRYSDIEKGIVLGKLARAGVAEETIIRQYMPRIGLEHSKKLYDDLKQVETLSPGMQRLLHETGVSLRIFFILYAWDEASRTAAEMLFAALRPGANKWRDLLEQADETARRDGVSPAQLLDHPDIRAVLAQENPAAHEKYNRVLEIVRERRFPVFSELHKKALLALDKLRFDPKITCRIQDNFESEEIRLELKFTAPEQLAALAGQLAQAAQSQHLVELISLLRTR